MNSNKSFGEIVRELREEKRLTLREVSEELGIDTSTLGKIEKDSRKPSKDLVDKFSEFYKVSKKELAIAYISDTVIKKLSEESYAKDILKAAAEKLEFLQKNKNS